MFDFKTFKFGAGAHPSRDKGMCVMEAVAYVAGEPHSDHPACACPIISAFLRSWNDGLSTDKDRQRLLGGFVFRLVATKASAEIELKRSMMAFRWLVNVLTPSLLEMTPSLVDHAKTLRKIKISKKLSAAYSAALSAARSAAYSAARSAAYSAAYSALAPTIKKLQRSAQRLLIRMIKLTEPQEAKMSKVEVSAR